MYNYAKVAVTSIVYIVFIRPIKFHFLSLLLFKRRVFLFFFVNLTNDNVQRHVTAFRPISVEAHSWSMVIRQNVCRVSSGGANTEQYDTIRYDTIRDAILTCARKPT